MARFTWETRIYFPIAQPWDTVQFDRVLTAVEAAGLLIPFASEEWAAWIVPTGRWRDRRVAVDRYQTLQILQEHGGGFLCLASSVPDVRATLSLDPQALVHYEGETERASAFYGNLSLSVDLGTMLDDGDVNLLPEAVMLVWRCSLAMARSVYTVYGMGDFVNRNLSSPIFFRDDLDNLRVPRLAWWNYFGSAYCNHWQEAEWPGAGVWAAPRDDHGWTVIMRPPYGPLRATNEEFREIFG